MKPWDVIGWLILGGGAVLVLTQIVTAAVRSLLVLIAHLETRSIPPAKGQQWRQGDSSLYISDITDAGRICIQTRPLWDRTSTSSSWSDSPEAWRKRVRSRQLWLVEGK